MKKNIIEIDFSSQIKASESCDCGLCDEEECQCPCHGAKAKSDDPEDEVVVFSIKVVEALTSKAQEHNTNEQNSSVAFEELLEAYRAGADLRSAFKGQTLGELAMARVNLLLRAKSGQFKDILSGKDEEKVKKELSGLIFNIENDSILLNGELDMFDSWTPQEGDFIRAREDIEKYDLNYDFQNIDELYLSKYEQIPLEFD